MRSLGRITRSNPYRRFADIPLVIELRVAKENIGKVIGKHGRTITPMRTILYATQAQKDKRHVLEVLD
jgi:predicted RNA-binding protein YlqC (UPF0109 family)